MNQRPKADFKKLNNISEKVFGENFGKK